MARFVKIHILASKTCKETMTSAGQILSFFAFTVHSLPNARNLGRDELLNA